MKKFLVWAPRIAGILFILFISLFALDVFEMRLGVWGTLFALFMHLIPSILLAVAVARHMHVERLEGHFSLKTGILGQINHTLGTFTQQLHDFKAIYVI